MCSYDNRATTDRREMYLKIGEWYNNIGQSKLYLDLFQVARIIEVPISIGMSFKSCVLRQRWSMRFEPQMFPATEGQVSRQPMPIASKRSLHGEAEVVEISLKTTAVQDQSLGCWQDGKDTSSQGGIF